MKPKIYALVTVTMLSFVLLTVLLTRSSTPISPLLFENPSTATEAKVDIQAGIRSTSGINPNILLIIGDDIGYNDFGENSDLYSFTPTLNALLENGIELTNFYAMPLCTPSRASLLTGKHPVQLGLQHWQVMPTEPWGLSTTEHIMPRYLKEQGYTTSLIGKWHLGHYKESALPQNRGFDTFIGFLSGGIDYLAHVCSEACIDEYTCMQDFYYNNDLITDHQYEYTSAVLTDYATELLTKQDPLTPFFMTLALPNIHLPLENSPTVEASEEFLKLAVNIVNEDRRTVAGMMMSLDQSVEAVLDALKTNDQYKNTVIIFVSDNGGLPNGGGSNFPLRGGKKYLFEGGVKVKSFLHSPLLPEELQGGKYAGLMHVSDVLPTVLQGMLSLNVDDIDSGKFSSDWYGVNQWNAITSLSGDEECRRSELLLNVDYLDKDHKVSDEPKQAIIIDGFKLILNENNQGWYAVPNEAGEEVVVSIGDPANFLFDLNNDHTELSNLYDQVEYSDKVVEMTRRLMQFRPLVQKSRYLPDDDSSWDVWAVNTQLYPWVTDETDSDLRKRLLGTDLERIKFESDLPKKALSECQNLLGYDKA